MSKQRALKKIETIIGHIVHLGGMLPPGQNAYTQEMSRAAAHLRDKIESGAISWPKKQRKNVRHS